MTNQRILIFSNAYYPFVGGAEVAIKEITDRLGEIEFDLITAKLGPGLDKIQKINNVTVYRVGCGIPIIDKLWSPFGGALLALRLKKQKPYNAFWGIMVTYATGAAYIANILSSKKTPIILTLQEGDSEEHLQHKWFGLIQLSWKLSLVRTTILTAISNYLLQRGERLGFKGQSALVPNGVDVKKFEMPRVERGDGKVVLVTASRLSEKNGLKDVIDALKLLPDNVVFKILGAGELEEELKKQVEILGLKERVDFAGFVDHSQMPYHFSRADIFIRPSLSEGMGNSFIEAMAASLPIIGTPVGGIPDFLKDGETGVFCQPHDPKSIADAVTKLMNNKELSKKVVENGLTLVKEKYDWDLIAQEMKERVFQTVL